MNTILKFSVELEELVGRKLEMAPNRMFQQLTDKTKKKKKNRPFYEAVDAHARRRLKKMDDPFGCLRGVELGELDLHKLTSEMVEKKFDELPSISHCPSCEVHLVYVVNDFCRECPECHRVFEYGDDQFQEVSPGRSAAPSAPSAHLKTVHLKWEYL